MTREELVHRLKKYEWADIECKEARNSVPKTAYKTVAAFANTAGGRLVFGVRDRAGALEIAGVSEVDKVQNEFLSTLRSGQKMSRSIDVTEDAVEADGKTLLVFHIPESPRNEKPVYLDGDIRQSFIRRGAGDERCTRAEIERFLRDAADDPYDSQIIDGLSAEEFYDAVSVHWYRRMFDEHNPGRRRTLTDREFLNEWGLVAEHGDRLAPTRAGVLLFGEPRCVHQVLSRPVVDCRFIDSAFDDWTPDRRWSDRIVIEENLIYAWLDLSQRYMNHAERPFRMDPETLLRDDSPPDYISFREAAVNLLIHQDYSDHGRMATIRFFRDRTLFWNPGDAFATTDELLEPTEKEVRNPAIITAFRRIGLSEQAGTGMRAIFRNWQRLGHVPPVIENDKAKKTFELRLLREKLIGEEQRRLQVQLGVSLGEMQARLFAFACRQDGVSLMDAKAVTGWARPQARKVLEALVAQSLLQPLDEDGMRYGLADRLADRPDNELLGHSESDQAGDQAGDQVGDQAGDQVRDQVGDQVRDRATSQVTETIDPAVADDQIDDQIRDQVRDQARDQVRDQAGDQVGDQVRDQVGDQAGDRAGDRVSDQVQAPAGLSPAQVEMLSRLSPIQWRVVELCAAPLRVTEIMAALGAVNRTHFRKRRLEPLILAGIVRMTNPDKPRAPDQQYVLTSAGAALKAARSGKSGGSESRGQE